MFSTHYPTPHRPSERELRMLDILSRQAADLIEREKAEQSLRQLGPILQSTDDAVIGIDLNERITAWNWQRGKDSWLFSRGSHWQAGHYADPAGAP